MYRSILIAACIAILSAGRAGAQSGGVYSIPSNTLDGGGKTPATGGVYRVSGTAGQPDAVRLVGGLYSLTGGFWNPKTSGAVDVPPTAEVLPRVFAARPASPNPFRSTTTLALDLPAPRHVQLVIHGIDGRVLRRLIDRDLPAGRHLAVWDGRDEQGRLVSSGIYFARIHAGEFASSMRVVHID